MLRFTQHDIKVHCHSEACSTVILRLALPVILRLAEESLSDPSLSLRMTLLILHCVQDDIYKRKKRRKPCGLHLFVKN